jgi:hypothetical protein
LEWQFDGSLDDSLILHIELSFDRLPPRLPDQERVLTRIDLHMDGAGTI